MKWSLFNQDNEALCRQVQAKLGLSDEELAGVRDRVANAEIELEQASRLRAENQKLVQEPKNSRAGASIHEVLSILSLNSAVNGLVAHAKPGNRIGVVYNIPRRNNDRFVYCLGKNKKSGKSKVIRLGIENPDDVNPGDLVEVSVKSVGTRHIKSSFRTLVQKRKNASSTQHRKKSAGNAYHVTKIGSL